MLISSAYKELQRDLHETQEYGLGVHANECAIAVSEIGNETLVETVLDYGSGAQSHLALLLPQYRVTEYDPAVPGKDATPAMADVVVCADVLEHIEPDCLGDVLQHIRCATKQFAVLVIATVPAGKTMKDGRNAHLIIENASWWSAQILVFFTIEQMESGSGRIFAICRPKPFQIGKINVTAAVSDEERNANARANCKPDSRWLDTRIPKHGRTAIVVCAGPSLRDTWPQIAMAQSVGADVFTTSIAHKFMIERGIIPMAQMDCDPREHKARQFGEPDNRVQYWLASCIHPDYIEKLRGFDVRLWHSYNGKTSRELFDIAPGHEIIVGGGSIGLRALSVLYCQGYRAFDIHGMDSSYADDGTDHCGIHLGKKLDTINVICGGRVFKSTAVNISYARYFFKSQRMLKGVTFNLYGNGLLAEMVKQGMMPDAIEDDTE